MTSIPLPSLSSTRPRATIVRNTNYQSDSEYTPLLPPSPTSFFLRMKLLVMNFGHLAMTPATFLVALSINFLLGSFLLKALDSLRSLVSLGFLSAKLNIPCLLTAMTKNLSEAEVRDLFIMIGHKCTMPTDGTS